ncbi:hypothetical protein AYO38_05410 [bacterium SCGC AG-212-C10]|nr:hypothetical protein AYO38_05410 [bacterium SCGC AG-212-C10]
MTYIRLSIAKPRHGQEKRLEAIMTELNRFAASQPGCRKSYLLHPHDDSGEIARISIYEDEASAEHAANTDHILSLRAELHLACEPGHTERAFFSEE